MRIFFAICAALAAAPLYADTTPPGVVVRLLNGNKIEGLLLDDNDKMVRLEIPIGEMGIYHDQIATVEYKTNPLVEFKERQARLTNPTPSELYALARWAQANGLGHYARETAERVVHLDRDHEGAHRILGHEKIEGQWMTQAEAKRARGLIWHQGNWISQAEYLRIARRQEEEARHNAGYWQDRSKQANANYYQRLEREWQISEAYRKEFLERAFRQRYPSAYRRAKAHYRQKHFKTLKKRGGSRTTRGIRRYR